MIDRFEVGKSYRWIGPKKPSEWFISDVASKQWEIGSPHKCRSIKGNGVGFYGIKNGTWSWAYAGYESNFEEVTE